MHPDHSWQLTLPADAGTQLGNLASTETVAVVTLNGATWRGVGRITPLRDYRGITAVLVCGTSPLVLIRAEHHPA